MTPEEVQGYRRRFLQTYGSLDARVLAARSRAIIGTDSLPATPQGMLAVSCLKKLKEGAEPGPTPMEFAALEYMIRAMRPAPLVHMGIVDAVTDGDFLTAFPLWAGFGGRFTLLANSIGLISKKTGSAPLTNSAEGTGFLVAADVIMTNRHVLHHLSNGVDELEKGQAIVEFRHEADNRDDDPAFDVEGVLAIHETQDVCLLKLSGVPGSPSLTLSNRTVATNSQVAAVGFPYPDSDRNPIFIGAIFGIRFGFKRVSPGLIIGGVPRKGTVYHDCSTLGGNSGSPVLSLEDCTVVGLHCDGGFVWKNEAVDMAQLVPWVKKVTNG